MSFLNDFIFLLKVWYLFIYIVIVEEECIEYLFKFSIKKYFVCICYFWDFIDGYKGNLNDIGFVV